MVPASVLDDQVVAKLIAMEVPGRLIPTLKRKLRASRVRDGEAEAARVRRLRGERRRVDEELRQLARNYARGFVSEESYEISRAAFLDAQRAAEWLLATRSDVPDATARDRRLLAMLQNFETTICGTDAVAARELVDALVERVEFGGVDSVLVLTKEARELLGENADQGSMIARVGAP